MNAELNNIIKDHEKEFVKLFNLSNINYKEILAIIRPFLLFGYNNINSDFILPIKRHINKKFNNKDILIMLNQYAQFLDIHFLEIIWAYKIELDNNFELQAEGEDKINLFLIFTVYLENTFINHQLKRDFIDPEYKSRIYTSLLKNYFGKLKNLMEQQKESNKNLDEYKELENLLRNLVLEISKIKSDNIKIIEHFLKQKTLEELEAVHNDEKYSIKKIALGWEINYNGERKLLTDIKGIYYFSKCLKAPQIKFKYRELMEVYYIDDLPLSSELIDIKQRLKFVIDEIKCVEFNFDDDPTANAVLIEKLESERKRLFGKIKQINLKSINYTEFDKKTAGTFTKACRTAMDHCQKYFPEFYEHINSYIKWKNGKISYSGDIDWY